MTAPAMALPDAKFQSLPNPLQFLRCPNVSRAPRMRRDYQCRWPSRCFTQHTFTKRTGVQIDATGERDKRRRYGLPGFFVVDVQDGAYPIERARHLLNGLRFEYT